MPRTPEETFHHVLDLLLAKDMDAFADLFATDGLAEFPFAAEDSKRQLTGREEIRGYLTGYPERMDMREVISVAVHHTERPDTIVVEWAASGRTVRTGESYRLNYVVILTVRDGLITRYRDYWNPLATAAAAGTLPALLYALSSGDAR